MNKNYKGLLALLIICGLFIAATPFAVKYWVGNYSGAEITASEATALSVIGDATDGITAAQADLLYTNSVYGASGIVVIADGNYTVLAANSGKTHIMPNSTAADTVDLPTEANGLYYKFIYGGGAEDAQNHQITSGATANYFIGGLAFQDLDGDVQSTVYSDGNSNNKITLVTPGAGTIVEVYCDGTNWYIYGSSVSNTVPAFAD